MKGLIIFLFFILSSSQIVCEQANDPYYLAITSGEPSALVEGNVNVITGDYVIDQNDIIVQGVEPLKIKRRYISRYSNKAYVGNFIFDDYFTITCKLDSIFLVTDPSGATLVYEIPQDEIIEMYKHRNRKIKLILNKQSYLAGLTNCSNVEISGRMNLKNNEVEIETKYGDIQKVFVYGADGSKRMYESYVKISKKDKDGMLKSFSILFEGRPFRLTVENLPNGNCIFYSYGDHGIKEIKSTNPTGTKTYAWMRFQYYKQNRDHYYYVATSDNKEVFYRLWRKGKTIRPKNKNPQSKRPTTFLNEIKSFDHVDETYHYKINEQTNRLKKYPMIKRSFPDDRNLEIVYNDSLHPDDQLFSTVAALKSAVGKDKTPHITHSFRYYPAEVGTKDGKTEVYDALGNKTVYNFSKYLRLTSIERYEKDNKLINREEFIWGDETSNEATYLLCKSFYDSNNNVIFSKKYTYDARGNPIKETIFGNISGENVSPIKMDDKKLPLDTNLESFSKRRKYSNDKKNYLIKEKDDSGLSINFIYHKNTDLLSSKIVKHKKAIKMRYFYEYDADNILIAEIIDDGTTPQKDNLKDVTGRQIKRITPNDSGKFINMPKIIEEKYLDLNKGVEKLIKKTVLTYSEMGKIIKEDVYDALNIYRFSIEREFDRNGNLIKEINPINQTAIYSYDKNFNKILEIPFSEKIKNTFEYDFSNRLISQLEESLKIPNDKYITTHTYDFKSNKTSTTDYLGNTIQYEYDSLSNVTKIIKPQITDQNNTLINPQINNLYDSASCIIEEKNEKGYIKTTSYNCYKKPTKILHFDGSKETFVYNLDGTLKFHIDQIGTKTLYEYDFLQRDTKITKISSNGDVLSKEEKTYSTFNILSKKDSEDNITNYTYDFSNKLISEKTDNEITNYYYDSLQRLYKTEIFNNENTLITIYERDLLNRIIEERKEDLSQNILFLEKYSYDKSGNKKCIIKYIKDDKKNDINITEKYKYDPFNRLIKHIDPLRNTTNIKYIEDLNQNVLQKITIDPVNLKTIETFNALGNLSIVEKRNNNDLLLSKEEMFYDPTNNLSKQILTIISPNSSTKSIETFWEYDSMNRPIKLIEANNSLDKKSTKYTYYENGQLHKTVKPDNTILENTYDALGHQTSLISSDSSVNYTYKHDTLGRLLSSYDKNTKQSIERTLDHKGRVLKEKLANDLKIQNFYDLAGRKIKQILSDQSEIEYIYDALYLKKIVRKDKNGYQLYEHNFSEYDLSGNLIEETLLNNLANISYKLNPSHKIISLDAYKQDSNKKTTYFHQKIDKLDPDGKIRKMSYSSPLGPDTSEFFYDELKQLTEEKGLFNKKYLFDSNKNRVQKDNDVYQINDLNQITQTENSTFFYDKNGNPIKNQTPDSEIDYHYDALDRLIEISKKNDYKLEFTYDSQHRRVSKIFHKLSNRLIYKPLIHKYTEYYIFDNQNEIGAYKDETLTHLRILKDSNQAEIGASIAIEINNNIYAPIHDIQGNITMLISDKTQNPYEFYRYSAFGEEKLYDSWQWERSTSYINNPWRFSSKRIDEESNLIYYGRRYYDSEYGRWLTPDPQGFTHGLNLYAFVNNDPLIYIDLYGLYALPGMFDQIGKPRKRMSQEPENPSQLFDFKLPEISPHKRIYFTNGINNSLADARASAMYLSEINKNRNIHVIYNEDKGTWRNLDRARRSLFGNNITKATRIMLSSFTDYLDQDKKNKILHICHSEGVINTKNALFLMLENYRKRISVVAIAPGAYINKGLTKDIVHYGSNGDLIDKLDFIGRLVNKNTIIKLKPHQKANQFFDHSFNSPTYQNKLIYHINSFINNN